ncbi:MAG: hypothetical protein NZ601_04630 [candidate division WOR-3 bacterium]|nr:hypothetical protein [candidate division WOR-3 bacterium]MCX7757246.1 hypothetical protein [candidate division WOR-3 bacterium]MDW7987590.1 hypothetical protein [candidate division WOR-3 bacterium]
MKAAIVLMLIFLTTSYGAFEDLYTTPRGEGLANAFSALSNDLSALQYNPAGLSEILNINVAGFYKLLYGGLGVGLHHLGFSFGYPLKGTSGALGLGVQEIGFQLHSEKILSFGYGFNLAKDLSVGAVFRGYALSQDRYGKGFSWGFDLGVIGRIYRRWQYGFVIHNLNNPQIGFDVKYDLPCKINVGLLYQPTLGINSLFEVTKEIGKPTRIAVAQELEIIEDYLTLRAGLITEPVQFNFGLRTGFSNLKLDYALNWKSELPLTHNLGISYNF